MRYLAALLFGLFIGCQIQSRAINVSAPVDIPVESKIPKEVEKQFDDYLAAKMAAGFFDNYILLLVKKVVEAIFVSTLIALITDYPVYSIFVVTLPIFLVSYPVARWVVKRYAPASLQTSVQSVG